jgi:Protein of unknown function (DUF1071)
MNQATNYFAHLNSINVNEHVETKGGFTYLSWPYAVTQLRMADPTATWEVRRFDGRPYLLCEAGVFVEVAVTVQGVTLSQLHPVLDARNRPIPEPDAFQVNTSIQRALVKAIALHGLGLYIYAGEDLPGSQDAANDAVAAPAPAPVPGSRQANSCADDEPRSNSRPVPATLSAAQQAAISRKALELGVSLTHVLRYFGVKWLKDLHASDFTRVMKALEQRRSAA